MNISYEVQQALYVIAGKMIFSDEASRNEIQDIITAFKLGRYTPPTLIGSLKSLYSKLENQKRVDMALLAINELSEGLSGVEGIDFKNVAGQ